MASPICYGNWKAHALGKARLGTLEAHLFTDTHIVGELRDVGPHDFLNVVTGQNPGKLSPRAVLRIHLHDERGIYTHPQGPIRTDASNYHGGDYTDEIAALVSLTLGRRVKAGPVDREFKLEGDPFGQPIGYSFKILPELSPPSRSIRIPDLFRPCDLSDLGALRSFSQLNEDCATALVKAARLYQEAIWLSDSDPHSSWLLLVSAIETIAAEWFKGRPVAAATLAESFPELAEFLNERGHAELIPEITAVLAPKARATAKFLGFIDRFCPAPPKNRPHENLQFKFQGLRTAMKCVYDHRSRALHDGIAMPAPMNDAPEDIDSDGRHSEIPLGLGTSTLGASWAIGDTPLLLHTFAYIVRGAILKWLDFSFAGLALGI